MKKIVLISLAFLVVNALRAQDLRYVSGNNDWNPDSLGNHRVVVQFTGTGTIAKAAIPWRRPDNSPELKRIIVQDGQTSKKVDNIKVSLVTNDSGVIYFEPLSGKGTYYIYYMPYKNEGRSNYPRGTYLQPASSASDNWWQSIPSQMKVNTVVKEIQSVNTFNSFYPMEVIASKKETANLLARNKSKAYLVFTEDRENPVVMKDRLPYRWVKKGAQTVYGGKSARGEFFTYQLAVYAIQDLDNIDVRFTDLKSGSATIPAKDINCFNTGGTDYTGAPFHKDVSVPAGQVQALWCGVDVPREIPAGVYKGKAIISGNKLSATTVDISLTVSSEVKEDGGISEPWKQTRLKWLNSTLAQDNNVVAPYTPLKVTDSSIALLGRKIQLDAEGFPKQIQTFFTEEMTGYKPAANNLLVEPIHFHFTRQGDGKDMTLKSKSFHFTKQSEGTVQWDAQSGNDSLQMEVSGSLEFDGFLAYTVKVTALADVQLKDIALHIPMEKELSKYVMGLGLKGGYRPELVDWKWDVASKNQDGAWVGSVNAGLQFSLRDERYVRPLNTNFYLQKPLLLPTSWGNGTKGGITIGEKGRSMLVNGYSGERLLKKGETLYYNFNLLITPFHPIDTDFQWATRFYHRYANTDTIKAAGATVANIHHATLINPWLNYPFIEYKKMKAYIDSAHQRGLKVKIYNTVRELSDRAYELFPMRSLGHEIYSPGKGGGFSWLQEHVGSDYIAAWFVPEIKDAAIINSGMSRWHNYYVEGMNWLVQNVGIDGIYLDDVAFDRVTMKRIKRVLTKDGHPGIIDLHSANQYNKSDGFNNSANLYMEHFPYLNRLWFGEYFDYEKNNPDFFLTEVSGIPFGLMGEMLQNGGNPWRGMIYGMTNRFPWTEEADPRQIWKFWDDFGMKGTEMIGYWSSNCPVKTTNEKVLATVYKKNGAALVSIASWADSDTEIKLAIDWSKLGIDPAKATITAKAIAGFQPAQTFAPDQSIPVSKGKGWLLIIR